MFRKDRNMDFWEELYYDEERINYISDKSFVYMYTKIHHLYSAVTYHFGLFFKYTE